MGDLRSRFSGEPDAALKVDLKTPLANERTLLRWLRSAVLLTAVSALLSSSPNDAAKLNGILLGGVALLFVFWPTCTFQRHSLQFKQASSTTGQPQAERTMPQVLALSLVCILAAALVVEACFGFDTGAALVDDRSQ